MDPLDSQIIEILKKDGRASNAGIARDVKVSEGTVRRRLKRLVDDGFIQVMAVPDAQKMGLNSRALVGLQVAPDQVDAAAAALEQLPEVTWVTMTSGQFDIFAWAALPSPEELGSFLRQQVGSIPGVRRTETFVNLGNHSVGNGIVV
ncbi:MAG: Lrp/AsnC family transcriptional regulator [SAR202 cluster bacterium]|nr:Lrp/AsnC family transcriptional regulator [SAR202 cluster bacterium]